MQVISDIQIGKWLTCLILAFFYFFPAYSQCPPGEGEVSITITTDQWGNETSWGLYEQNTGAVLASGSSLSGNTTYNYDVCVEEDSCFYFQIIDDAGDGMCCIYGNGSYSVSYEGNVVGSGGTFASSQSIFGIGTCTLDSPLVTDNTTLTPEQLVNDLLLGSCISAFNINYTGASVAIGNFSNGSAVGIDEGILLTTGNTDLAPGPNTSGEAGFQTSTPGDSLLQAVTGVPSTTNAASLEFDFISFNDSVAFNYIFASEEYNEFVCDVYNDVFGFFVSGNGFTPNTNIALVPGTAIPVAINSVNSGTPGSFPTTNPANCSSLAHAAYYVDNTGGQATQYDGYTVPLTATMEVTPCDTYHIKMVIADVGDFRYDSGIFLQAKSFSAGEGVDITATTSDGTKDAFEGCADGLFRFTRADTTNISDPIVINFNLSGNAIEGGDYQAIPHSVTIPANQLSADVNITAIADGIPEGVDTLILSYNDICTCTLTKNDTLYILDNAPLDITISNNNLSCLDTSATLTAMPSGGVTPYSYLWNTGDSVAAITVDRDTSADYIVIVTDNCGQADTASITVTDSTGVVANFLSNSPQCVNQNNFNFTNTSSYIGTATFFWDLANGNTETTEHVMGESYPAPGTYNVLLVVEVNGCIDSVFRPVTVTDAIFNTLAMNICETDSIYADGGWQNTPGFYIDTFTTASNCDSIVSIFLSIDDTSVTNINSSICAGDSVFAGGGWQTTPGVYTDVYTGVNTCDSTVVTTLSVSNQIVTPLNPTICEGDSFYAGGAFQMVGGMYADTFPTATACDSIVTTDLIVLDTSLTNLNITICDGDSVFAEGDWQTSSGIYTDVFSGANNCDSTVIIDLDVQNQSSTLLSPTICETDSVFAGGSFQNTPGVYRDTFTVPGSCDSIVTTNLIVLDTSLTNLNITICDGDSVFVGGDWQKVSGVYIDVFNGPNACDSTVVTTLDVSNQIQTILTPTICEGDSVFAGGAFQKITGTYNDTFPTATACDSFVTTNLTVLDTSLINLNISICDGDSVFAEGIWQKTSGIYTDIFAGANNCDSTVIIDLDVLNQSFTLVDSTICEGDSVFAGGDFQTTTGIYLDTFTVPGSCDSIVTTDLIVLDTSLTNSNISICDGDSVFAGGAWQMSSGVYTDIFTGANNCDSVVITTVDVINPDFTFFVFSICEGDSFYAGGTYQDTAGIYVDSFTAVNGCDSIVTTNVTVSDTSLTVIDTSICDNDSVFAAGMWQFNSGTYTDIFAAANGCDSTIITTLTVFNASDTTFTVSICEGDSILTGTGYQSMGGTYRDTFMAANACDSIVTTVLTVLDTSLTNIDTTICDGDSVFAGGAWQFTSGVYTDIFMAASGCDSTIITTLDVLNNSLLVINDTLCEGDSLFAGGDYQFGSGTYFDTLMAANGCDSVITTFLTVFDTVFMTLNTSICAGDSIFAAGSWQFSSGIYTDIFTTSDGCDSTVIINLSVDSTINVQRDLTICQGSSAYAGGMQQTMPGVYMDTSIANGGCDSIVTTNLFVADTFRIDTLVTICQGDSFFAGGAWQRTSDTYFDFLTTSAGCDSTIITDLSVIPAVTTSITDTICQGQTYPAGGALQDTSGVYIDNYNAASGCDSIVITDLTVLDTFWLDLNQSICEGDSFFVAGAWQKTPGVYIDNWHSAAGCDSTISINLSVDSASSTVLGVQICDGESYVAGGAPQTTSGTYTDHYTSMLTGCDSVVTTNLTLNNTSLDSIPLAICQGDSVFADGSWQTTSGIYVDSLSTVNSCDSIIVIDLSVVANDTSQTDTTICEGETVFAGGAFQSQSGVYTDYFNSAGSCDSIHITTLSVIPINLNDFTTTICPDSTITLSAPGGFDTYVWSPGGETSSSIPAEPGQYFLTVTDTNDCQATANYIVNESDPIDLAVEPDSTRILEGERVTIVASTNSSNGISYYWSPLTGLNCGNCNDPVATPDDDIIYTVIATDEFGCSETGLVKIFIDTIPLPTFYIPNAFTPNGDGMNDVFKVYGSGIVSLKLKIFDRWGEQLFETTNQDVGWDGTFRGERCLPGVYVYYLEVGFNNNLRPKDFRVDYIKGSVTLIR